MLCMDDEHSSMLSAHLRAIRSAIVGLALAVLAAAYIISSTPSDTDFYLFLLSLVMIVYSFVPPLVYMWRNP